MKQFSSLSHFNSGNISSLKSNSGLKINKAPAQEGGEKSTNFIDVLKDSINNVNNSQKAADSKSIELSSGKNDNLHETMLSISEAELAFKLMVQVRNKALEAYQEVMRMPV